MAHSPLPEAPVRAGDERRPDEPGFLHLAEAYGARGVRLDRLDGLRAALAEGLASDRLTVIEAPGDIAHPDAVPLPRY
jgi:thiamine pyrophosphate-dependent acetolactate synthase large subunit-like protein